ncbi:hypothetical protein CI109_102110 [Kwoniella shandongensis]|uniref:Uncharacterized protein n=1 Tax=Kwoniella shandongensis TaxID=1734106 RepID=A0A5M6BSS4_9TREE|nr:uncharacterized protein CI109_005881 [Kwoniella shandongensis]KAA5525857.1 hypothetical protein CI109_005881 [Kwoniella shandongensis]
MSYSRSDRQYRDDLELGPVYPQSERSTTDSDATIRPATRPGQNRPTARTTPSTREPSTNSTDGSRVATQANSTGSSFRDLAIAAGAGFFVGVGTGAVLAHKTTNSHECPEEVHTTKRSPAQYEAGGGHFARSGASGTGPAFSAGGTGGASTQGDDTSYIVIEQTQPGSSTR